MKSLKSLVIGFVGLVSIPHCATLYATDLETLAVVRELDDVDVPAERDGLIFSLTVRKGHRVTAQQLLASLDSTENMLKLKVAQAELKQVKVKAENLGPVETAKAAVARAEKEDQLLGELGKNAVYLEKFRMRNNLDKTAAELQGAKNQLLQDQLMIDVKLSQLRMLENDIERASVHSPVDGVVHQILKQQGEWVRQGEPIVKVTRMDRLLVEGFVESRKIAPHQVTGSNVSVSIQLANGETSEFDAMVVEHSAPKLELDGKFAVWVEIENRLVTDRSGIQRWMICPGMSGKMTISND